MRRQGKRVAVAVDQCKFAFCLVRHLAVRSRNFAHIPGRKQIRIHNARPADEGYSHYHDITGLSARLNAKNLNRGFKFLKKPASYPTQLISWIFSASATSL